MFYMIDSKLTKEIETNIFDKDKWARSKDKINLYLDIAFKVPENEITLQPLKQISILEQIPASAMST